MKDSEAKVTEGDGAVDLAWGVGIPLRDGVHLNATLYRPKESEATPAIFTLTPYIADTYHERAIYFAKHGYAYLLVDCRGRGNSEGEFEPFVNEGPDGHDVVEWLADQSWCNGKVAMWGGSYAGFDQWMTLKEFPPHLETIVPAASAHAAIDFPFRKNILFPYEIRWLTLTSGLTSNVHLFEENDFWIEKFRELYLQHRPFRELDRVVGNTSSVFQTWMDHPTPDEYWHAMSLTPREYRKIDVPVLTITGHYDGDQPGAMQYYRQHMEHASKRSRDRHYVVIGPWDHHGTRTPNREFGGMKFGEASLLDLNRLHKEWYDWTMKDGEKPEFLKERVAYYLMGAEEWRYAKSLDVISKAPMRLYLNSEDGQANGVFRSGRLEEEPPKESDPDHYVYDPLDIRPADLERVHVEAYLTDQRYALNLFGNGLVYHSSPFEEETEITGYIRLAVWISLDVPDTDFVVTLAEIMADGSHLHLTRDLLRARHRSSLRVEDLVTPGEINLYEFDGFTFFSRRVAKGSRLRLLLQSPNSIFIQKNYNSGGSVVDESEKDARTAHVAVYHDADHLSFLELPVVVD